MIHSALEKRKFPRIDRAPLAANWVSGPRRPVLVNVGAGGACLLFHDLPFAPQRESSFFLHLQNRARKLLLRARLVWLRHHDAEPDIEHHALPGGWLAGIAFETGQLGVSHSQDLNDPLEVSLLPVDGVLTAGSHDSGGAAEGPIVDDRAITIFNTAAENLLPVLAKHFTDVQIVLTRDRLEISAPFRSLQELEHHETPQRNARAPKRAGRSPAASGAPGSLTARHPAEDRDRKQHLIEAPQAPQRPAARETEPDAARARPATHWLRERRIMLAAAAILIAVVVGPSIPRIFAPAATTVVAPAAPLPGRGVPAWASELDAVSRDGWIKVQTQFALSDTAVESAIRILKTNERYFPGHQLRDLTQYPAQVGRAFTILAERRSDPGFDLGALKESLQGRLANGARFPDEPAGYRYFSNLDPRLFHNTVIVAIVELLHSKRDDPAVQQLLAGLPQRAA